MPVDQTLNQLRDLHLPPPISFWPLANGWYLVFFLGLLILSVVLYIALKRHQRLKPKRYALAQLKFIEEAYHSEQWTASKACQEISKLVRRVAIAYGQRSQVANLSGAGWIDYLSTSDPRWKEEPFRRLMEWGPYTRTLNSLPASFFILVKEWIDHYV